MTSQEFKSALLAKSPHFALSNQRLFDVLANKNQRQGQFSQFGPLYELFIYSFFIGIHVNSRIELPPRKHTTEFAKIGAWKRESPIINFILFIVFSHSDEIGFDWNALEHMEEKELESVLKNIVTFIEEYAHGGLNYLKTKYDNDELDNSQYLFIDVLDEVIQKRNDDAEDKILDLPREEIAITVTDSERIQTILKTGETSSIEFKSTLRVNMHTKLSDKAMEHSCMKTLAAFVNTTGGTLLIGINDSKQVLGLEHDFATFNSKKDPLDEFQKHLDNVIEQYFDNSFYSHIEINFPKIEEKIICEIRVKANSKGPVMLINKTDSNREEFYIRRSASTKALSASEMINYIKAHWN